MALPHHGQHADQQFAECASQFLARLFSMRPVLATSMGIHEHDDRLRNFDRYSLHEELALTREFLHSIDKVSVVDLTGHNRLDYRIARAEAQMMIAEFEHQNAVFRRPDIYLDEAVYGCYLLMARSFAPVEQRAVSLLARLRQVPKTLRSAEANILSSAMPFVETARMSAQGALQLYREGVDRFTESVSPPSLQRLLRTAAEEAATAVESFLHWLNGPISASADLNFALGRVQYDYAVQVGHMLDEDADSLLAYGENSVQQTVMALQETAAEIAPSSSWAAVIDSLKNEHPSAEELPVAYAREAVRAREFVREKDLVTFPENEALEMVETPAFARPLLPYAAYMPAAALDQRQTGQFWVTPLDTTQSADRQRQQMRGHSIWGIPVIALHEAYPGHHLQISTANRHPSLLRRFFGQSALFAEGWALYCEEMMWEQGFYSDARTRLLHLKDLLWRACRVVVDTGLHTRGMRVEDAVDYMVETAHLERPNAEAEVRRYCCTPTQPMTYLLGRREILQMRADLRKRRRKRFSLREFHDQLLSFGTVPFRVIREEWELQSPNPATPSPG